MHDFTWEWVQAEGYVKLLTANGNELHLYHSEVNIGQGWEIFGRLRYEPLMAALIPRPARDRPVRVHEHSEFFSCPVHMLAQPARVALLSVDEVIAVVTRYFETALPNQQHCGVEIYGLYRTSAIHVDVYNSRASCQYYNDAGEMAISDCIPPEPDRFA